MTTDDDAVAPSAHDRSLAAYQRVDRLDRACHEVPGVQRVRCHRATLLRICRLVREAEIGWMVGAWGFHGEADMLLHSPRRPLLPLVADDSVREGIVVVDGEAGATEIIV